MNNFPEVRTPHCDTNGVYATLAPCTGYGADTHFVFRFTIPASAAGTVSYDSTTRTTVITYTSGAQTTASDIAVGDALIATLADMGVL